MSYGLSDRDRERLERGRREAAEKMAQERQRLDDEAGLEAKQRKQNERVAPRTATGPDGVPVRLWVAPSGTALSEIASATPSDGMGCLILLPLVIVGGLVDLFSHLVVYRMGYTVHVHPEGHPKIKLRERSEEAAAHRLAALDAAIKQDGITGLHVRRGQGPPNGVPQ
jgi:hypothetical protein